jgi:hypothetical protein
MPADVAPEVLEARGVTVLQPGRDIDALIAAKATAGVDAIKIIVEDGPARWYPKPRLSDEQIGKVIAAAHAQSLPVFAHVTTSQLTRVVVEAGMAERRTWYVSTFSPYEGILTWARKQRESDPYALAGVVPSAIESLTAPAFLDSAAEDEPGALGYLRRGSENLRRAAAADVPLALGTDVNNPFVFPGYSAHEELALMVRAGLTRHRPCEPQRSEVRRSSALLTASERSLAVRRGCRTAVAEPSRPDREQPQHRSRHRGRTSDWAGRNRPLDPLDEPTPFTVPAHVVHPEVNPGEPARRLKCRTLAVGTCRRPH